MILKKTKLSLGNKTTIKAGKKASLAGKLNAKIPNPLKKKKRG